jgi:polyisoprenoid-binding protein YceI
VKRALYLALLLWMTIGGPATGADMRIDDSRSYVDFGVRLLWLRKVEGRFEQIDGEVTLNPHHDQAQVQARIAVASFRMDSERFRGWVMAPEFFDAEHYPTIYFRSSPIPLELFEQGGELSGTLTIRGISKEVRFEMLPSATPCLASQQACVINLSGSLQRSDFGMLGHRTALSDRVDLDLQIALHPEQPDALAKPAAPATATNATP